jgi:hypothetical protein
VEFESFGALFQIRHQFAVFLQSALQPIPFRLRFENQLHRAQIQVAGIHLKGA